MNTKRDDYNPFCGQVKKPVVNGNEGEINRVASRVENASFVEVKFKSSITDNGLSDPPNTATTIAKNTVILLTGLLCLGFV